MTATVQAGSGRRRGKARGQPQPPPTETGPSAAVVAEAVGKEILRQVERRPYATILVAATVGYMVAVATPNWAVKLAWTVGSRVAVSRMVASLS